LLIVYATKTKQAGKSCAGWDIKSSLLLQAPQSFPKKKQQHHFGYFDDRLLEK
jgi:hypothetical protein